MATNEQIIRDLYLAAEVKDVEKFISMFTDDGLFWDVSAGQKWYGRDVGRPVEIYAAAFPDMHRELQKVHVAGDVVVVELTLNGTQSGPLELPIGTIAPTGNEMHAPCCDVFTLTNGKVESFDCYTAATIMLGQLGVLALQQTATH